VLGLGGPPPGVEDVCQHLGELVCTAPQHQPGMDQQQGSILWRVLLFCWGYTEGLLFCWGYTEGLLFW